MNHGLPLDGIAFLTTHPISQTPAPAPERSFEERLAGARLELDAYARRLMPPGKGLAGAHRDHEDLVQDALQRALARRESFDGTRAMLPWLKQLLLRVFLDQRKRLLASPEGTSPENVEDHNVADPQVFSGAQEPAARVEKLLARLDEPERGILDRFHRRGQSVARIAQDLGLPVGTVKSHLHRARRRLRASESSNSNSQTHGGRS